MFKTMFNNDLYVEYLGELYEVVGIDVYRARGYIIFSTFTNISYKMYCQSRLDKLLYIYYDKTIYKLNKEQLKMFEDMLVLNLYKEVKSLLRAYVYADLRF